MQGWRRVPDAGTGQGFQGPAVGGGVDAVILFSGRLVTWVERQQGLSGNGQVEAPLNGLAGIFRQVEEALDQDFIV